MQSEIHTDPLNGPAFAQNPVELALSAAARKFTESKSRAVLVNPLSVAHRLAMAPFFTKSQSGFLFMPVGDDEIADLSLFSLLVEDFFKNLEQVEESPNLIGNITLISNGEIALLAVAAAQNIFAVHVQYQHCEIPMMFVPAPVRQQMAESVTADGMVRVPVADLPLDQSLPTDLYLAIVRTRHYVPVIKKGSRISAGDIKKFLLLDTTFLHIPEGEWPTYLAAQALRGATL